MVDWPVDEAFDEVWYHGQSLWWGQAPHLKARTQMEERKYHQPMILYVGTPPTRLHGLKVPHFQQNHTSDQAFDTWALKIWTVTPGQDAKASPQIRNASLTIS